MAPAIIIEQLSPRILESQWNMDAFTDLVSKVLQAETGKISPKVEFKKVPGQVTNYPRKIIYLL